MKREVRGFMKGVTAIFLVVALMVFAEGTNMRVFAAEEAAGAASAGASAGTATAAGITTGTIVAGAVVAAAAVAIVASSGGGGDATTPGGGGGGGNDTQQSLDSLQAADPELATALAALNILDNAEIAAVGSVLAALPDAATANQLGAYLLNMTLADAKAAATTAEFQAFLAGLNADLAAAIRTMIASVDSLAELQAIGNVLAQVTTQTLSLVKAIGTQMVEDPAAFKEGADAFLTEKHGTPNVTPPIQHVAPPTHHAPATHH